MPKNKQFGWTRDGVFWCRCEIGYDFATDTWERPPCARAENCPCANPRLRRDGDQERLIELARVSTCGAAAAAAKASVSARACATRSYTKHT